MASSSRRIGSIWWVALTAVAMANPGRAQGQTNAAANLVVGDGEIAIKTGQDKQVYVAARYGEVFGTQEQSARWEVSQGTTISKTSIHTMPAAAERQLFDYPSASMAQPAVPMLRWTEAPAESIRNHFS